MSPPRPPKPERAAGREAGTARYVALIGDLVHSRAMEAGARGRVQGALESAFRRVNRAEGERRPGVAAELLLTLGDEFQGLFEADGAGAEALVLALEAALGAVRGEGGGAEGAPLRFGLGVGGLSTARKPRALGMDGPCFHRAREALEAARRSGEACRLVGLPGGGAPEGEGRGERAGSHAERAPGSALAAHAEVWSLLATAWIEALAGRTEAQREAAGLAREGLSGKAIAERLGVTPGAVSQRLKAARHAFAERAREALARDLAALLEEGDPPA